MNNILSVMIGSNVLSYVNMVCATLRHSIPKSIVYCQVREAKRSLLDHFFTDLGGKEVSCFIRFPWENEKNVVCIIFCFKKIYKINMVCRRNNSVLCWMRILQ